MQGLPTRLRSGRSFAVGRRPAQIDWVAHDRMTGGRHVNADLMGAAGGQAALPPARPSLRSMQLAKPAYRALAPPCPPGSTMRHAFAVPRITPDRALNLPRRRADGTPQQSAR